MFQVLPFVAQLPDQAPQGKETPTIFWLPCKHPSKHNSMLKQELSEQEFTRLISSKTLLFLEVNHNYGSRKYFERLNDGLATYAVIEKSLLFKYSTAARLKLMT